MDVNKGELAKIIAERMDITIPVARDMISTFADVVISTVAAGDKVTLIGFGTFGPKLRAARPARNPQTNVPLTIPERYIPSFHAGKRFRTLMLGLKTESNRYD